MKRKITFPDWTSPAAVTITRGGTKDKPRAVWGTYTEEPAEWLSLRVTLEIAGGSVLFPCEHGKANKADESLYGPIRNQPDAFRRDNENIPRSGGQFAREFGRFV